MDYKKMSFISGVVVFIAFVIFFSSILWLSGQHILFSNKYVVYFRFADVVGLRDRSPVYMRGYRVGWTKDVFFEKDSVRVRIDIKKKFRVPMDSKIEITTLNLIGEKAVSITPGVSTTYLEPGGILDGQNKDIMILAKNILIETREKIREGELDNKIKHVASAIDSFQDLMKSMTNRIKKVNIDMYNRQIKEIGQAGTQLKDFLVSAQEDTRKFTEDSKSAMENLSKTLERLNQVSIEIKTIAQKINQGEGTAGELLNNKQLIENVNATITKLNEFLADIKKHPKKYVRFSLF